MTAFIVVTLTISDLTAYKEYTTAIAGLSAQFGGEAIVKGPVSECIEGKNPEGEIVVVVRFPNAEKALAYVNSDTYQKGKKLREGAAEVTMRLIEA